MCKQNEVDTEELYSIGTKISIGPLHNFHCGEVVECDERVWAWVCDEHCNHNDEGERHALSAVSAVEKHREKLVRQMIKFP